MQILGKHCLIARLVGSVWVLALTFHAFVECPFCPCQCCSIDDQDNYKPVNQQLAHETYLRSSWDLSHEYCMCISVTMLKLLCTNITGGELFWHWPVIFLTVFLFLFDISFILGVFLEQESSGRRMSEWETVRRMDSAFPPHESPVGKGGERLTAWRKFN